MNSNLTRRTFLKYSFGGAGLTLAIGFTPFGWKLAKAAETLSVEFENIHQAPFDVTDSAAVKAGIDKIEREIGDPQQAGGKGRCPFRPRL